MAGNKHKSVTGAVLITEAEIVTDSESTQTELVEQSESDSIDTAEAVAPEVQPEQNRFCFDFYIIAGNHVAETRTVFSTKENEAEAIADATEQLGELNWRYTGNFRKF